MKEIIELYFHEKINRYRIIAHLYFVLLMVMITNYFVEKCFGLYYNNSDFNFKNMINFILSTEAILIVISFFVTVWLFYYMSRYICQLIAIGWYWIISKKYLQEKEYFYHIVNFMFSAFKKDEQDCRIIYKNKGFDDFKDFVSDLRSEDMLVTKIMEFINAILIATIVVYYCHGLDKLFSLWVTIPLTFYCCLYPINLISRYVMQFNSEKYLEILLEAKTENKIN